MIIKWFYFYFFGKMQVFFLNMMFLYIKFFLLIMATKNRRRILEEISHIIEGKVGRCDK